MTIAAAHKCIKPQCHPTKCTDCNCAIAPNDEAGQLVLDLLNTFATDGLDLPFEDGDSQIVDRARKWLQNRPTPAPCLLQIAEPAAPQAALAAVPLPLLVRDIARELGITVPQACIALKPLGSYSTNSAVTAEMARMLRDHFPDPAPMPVAHPHHCNARTADGSCEECEGHAQAMAEWNAERAALAATPAAPSVSAVTDEQIDAILDSPGGMDFVVSDKRGRLRLFARRVLALAAAGVPAAAPDARDAARDSAFAHGMQRGWNLCIADDHETFSRVLGEFMTSAATLSKSAIAAQAAAKGVA